MATPNYGFEKRQKELAKKRKKEDKLKAKSDRKSGLLPEDGDESEDGQDPEGTTQDTSQGTDQVATSEPTASGDAAAPQPPV